VNPPDRTVPEGGWDSLKVDELKDVLEARGLPKSGTKAELVARLEESDAEGGAAPAAASEAAEAEAPAAEDLEAVAAEETGDAAAPAAEPVSEEPAAEAAEAPDEGIAEEVVPPAEPAEEPSADEVEEAEAPQAEEGEPETEAEEELEAEVDEEEPEAEGDEDAEGDAPAPATRRRGSAETSTTVRRAAPRLPDGDVVVRARSKYVRSAPRKARLVMDHIRGKEVEQARAILVHAPRAVAEDILKLLNSAVANAESNYELGSDELRVRKAFVDEGPTIKRFRPRALGRATRIQKRTSHMTIELTTTGNGR
jgi:large subunit ribosomal protein L22